MVPGVKIPKTGVDVGDGRKVKLLAIFAAASLTGVFPQIDKAPRYQFAGSDQLAFQILQGRARPTSACAGP